MPPSNETSSSPPTPQTLYSFPHLPPEIRTQVQNLAHTFFPNIIQIRPLFTPHATHSHIPPSPKALAATNWGIGSTTSPMLLHINREARTHFQNSYSRPFSRLISRHPSSLVFNHEIDTLLIHIYMTPNVPFDISVIFPALFSPTGLDDMYTSIRFLAGNRAFWEHILVFAARRGIQFQGLEIAVLVLEEDEDWEMEICWWVLRTWMWMWVWSDDEMRRDEMGWGVMGLLHAIIYIHITFMRASTSKRP
ncbi:hypothetical protein DL95DRAFT_473401 [Leptodontidium sp. 2 PMI_412]|nr:hypothetical protein DL95DRAFT_473401 [Leptodontidium sp. 2 PMI_412]